MQSPVLLTQVSDQGEKKQQTPIPPVHHSWQSGYPTRWRWEDAYILQPSSSIYDSCMGFFSYGDSDAEVLLKLLVCACWVVLSQ